VKKGDGSSGGGGCDGGGGGWINGETRRKLLGDFQEREKLGGNL